MAVRTATARAGESLDALLWRALGATAAVTEQALELNAGLAAIAAALPEGQVVVLPTSTAKAAFVSTAPLVQLWT